MTTTVHIGLNDFTEGQKNAATQLNTNQDILDTIVQLYVVNGTPPVAPPVSGVAEGAAYIVPASATGDWANQDDNIAVFRGGWTFRTPRIGTRAWDETNLRLTIWLGHRWQPFQAIRVAELTDSSGGSATTTITGVIGTGDDVTINDNFATINAQINAFMDAQITAQQMAADVVGPEVVDEAIGITEGIDDLLNI